jgi:hypothetical protein
MQSDAAEEVPVYPWERASVGERSRHETSESNEQISIGDQRLPSPVKF